MKDKTNGKQKIYLIACNDRTKIGISLDPLKRLAELQTACPYPLHLHKTYDLDDIPAGYAEKVLHRVFRDHHVQGEWFAVPAGKLALNLEEIIPGMEEEFRREFPDGVLPRKGRKARGKRSALVGACRKASRSSDSFPHERHFTEPVPRKGEEGMTEVTRSLLPSLLTCGRGLPARTASLLKLRYPPVRRWKRVLVGTWHPDDVIGQVARIARERTALVREERRNGKPGKRKGV